MPCNYKNYPANWKTEIRPAILERANNCCEICGVKNRKAIFRGYIDKGTIYEKEVYQDFEGRIFDASNSKYIKMDCYEPIEPLSGNPNQKAIRVVLTVSHTDHDTSNNDYSNLKALCQRCHLRHDIGHHKQTRSKKKKQIPLF